MAKLVLNDALGTKYRTIEIEALMKRKTRQLCVRKIRDQMREQLPGFLLLKEGPKRADLLHFWAEGADNCLVVVRFEFHNRFDWFTVSLGVVPDLTWIGPDLDLLEPSEFLAGGASSVGGRWIRLRRVSDPDDLQDRWWEIERLPSLDADVDEWINRSSAAEAPEKVNKQVELAIEDLVKFGLPFLISRADVLVTWTRP